MELASLTVLSIHGFDEHGMSDAVLVERLPSTHSGHSFGGPSSPRKQVPDLRRTQRLASAGSPVYFHISSQAPAINRAANLPFGWVAKGINSHNRRE